MILIIYLVSWLQLQVDYLNALSECTSSIKNISDNSALEIIHLQIQLYVCHYNLPFIHSLTIYWAPTIISYFSRCWEYSCEQINIPAVLLICHWMVLINVPPKKGKILSLLKILGTVRSRKLKESELMFIDATLPCAVLSVSSYLNFTTTLWKMNMMIFIFYRWRNKV